MDGSSQDASLGSVAAKRAIPSPRDLLTPVRTRSWVNTLPWSEIAVLVPHAALYITLSMVMIFKVDGYLANNDAKDQSEGQSNSKLQSSDVITIVSTAATITNWVAGMWFSTVVTKCGYIIWSTSTAETHDLKKTISRIRWTMDRKTPFRIDWRRDYVLIRICLLLASPALFTSPILQGALDWKASSEGSGYTEIESADPSAIFWHWNWVGGRARDGLANEEIWGAASLAAIVWDNANSSIIQQEATRQTCRHVINHALFPVGSRVFNAVIPCIIVHDVSWPDLSQPGPPPPPGRLPPDVQAVLDYPQVVSTSGFQIFGGLPGTMAIFDPTNKTLPTPPVLSMAANQGSLNNTAWGWIDPPLYPTPFLWPSSVMRVLVTFNRTWPYPPYEQAIFGPLNASAEAAHGRNIVPTGDSVRFSQGKLVPERYTAYLSVNFTAGVVNVSSSGATYVRSTVIETVAAAGSSSSSNNDSQTTAAIITPGPWVREALLMLSDVVNCMVRMNSSLAIPTWNNIEAYTATAIRFGYMAAWSNLQRKYEPNSTTLTVEVQQPRLQAVVSRWRVGLWLCVNVLFSASWVGVWRLRRQHPVVKGMDGFAEFVKQLCEGSLRGDDGNERSNNNRGCDQGEGVFGRAVTPVVECIIQGKGNG